MNNIWSNQWNGKYGSELNGKHNGRWNGRMKSVNRYNGVENIMADGAVIRVANRLANWAGNGAVNEEADVIENDKQ